MGREHGRRYWRALGVGAAVAVTGAVVLLPALAQAATATYYVATNGSDSNAGTLAAPLATIQKAVSLVSAGGTIAVRGGTYALSTNITISKSGTSSAPITLTNYGSIFSTGVVNTSCPDYLKTPVNLCVADLSAADGVAIENALCVQDPWRPHQRPANRRQLDSAG